MGQRLGDNHAGAHSAVGQAVDDNKGASGAVFVLDGQNLRHDLNKGLPQDRAGRTENWRRAAHVARQFNEAGLLTPASRQTS